jgi:hypothetical protein
VTRAKGKAQAKRVNQQQQESGSVMTTEQFSDGITIMTDSDVMHWSGWWLNLPMGDRPQLACIGGVNSRRVARVLATMVQGGSEIAGSHVAGNETVRDSVRQARASVRDAKERDGRQGGQDNRAEMRRSADEMVAEVTKLIS